MREVLPLRIFFDAVLELPEALGITILKRIEPETGGADVYCAQCGNAEWKSRFNEGFGN